MVESVTGQNPNPWYIFENVHDFNNDGLRDNLWVEPNFDPESDEDWVVYAELTQADGALQTPVLASSVADRVMVSTLVEMDYNPQTGTFSQNDTGLLGYAELSGDFNSDGMSESIMLELGLSYGADSQHWDVSLFQHEPFEAAPDDALLEPVQVLGETDAPTSDNISEPVGNAPPEGEYNQPPTLMRGLSRRHAQSLRLANDVDIRIHGQAARDSWIVRFEDVDIKGRAED